MNKKGLDFGTPLSDGIAVLVLIIILLVFAVYFVVINSSDDVMLDATTIPDTPTIINLLKSPMNDELTLQEGLVLAYEEKQNRVLEPMLTLKMLRGAKDECIGPICITYMQSLEEYIKTLTEVQGVENPHWLFVVYKYPENKVVKHLSRAPQRTLDLLEYGYLTKTGINTLPIDMVMTKTLPLMKITKNKAQTSSTILPLPNGGGSLKIYLWYEQ